MTTTLEQYFSSKVTSSQPTGEQARRFRDGRAAMYQAFAEDERAAERRADRSPLVQWAQRSVSEQPTSAGSKSALSLERRSHIG